MASTSVIALKVKAVPVGRQSGELARLRVLKGPDRSAVFIITNSRVSIGRGEENDVMIADLKASRLHAEVTSSPTGWTIKDLGSANGILLNGKLLRSSNLKTGDLVTIGESTLEFLGADADLNHLKIVPQDDQEFDKFIRDRVEAKETRRRNLSDPFGLNQQLAKQAPSTNNPKRVLNLVLAGAAVLGLVLFWDQIFSTPAKKQKKRPQELVMDASGPQDLQSLLPKLERRVPPKSAEMFFKQGFREYREKNYLRALNQFELVLQIDPSHEMARRYRDNSKRAIEEDVEANLERGKRAWTAGKLRQAKAHYEAVRRILGSDQSNPAYSEATEQLKKLNSEMEAD